MKSWAFEAAWAGVGLLGAGLVAGLAVVAVVGVGLLMFGLTQSRRTGP